MNAKRDTHVAVTASGLQMAVRIRRESVTSSFTWFSLYLYGKL